MLDTKKTKERKCLYALKEIQSTKGVNSAEIN